MDVEATFESCYVEHHHHDNDNHNNNNNNNNNMTVPHLFLIRFFRLMFRLLQVSKSRYYQYYNTATCGGTVR